MPRPPCSVLAETSDDIHRLLGPSRRGGGAHAEVRGVRGQGLGRAVGPGRRATSVDLGLLGNAHAAGDGLLPKKADPVGGWGWAC